MRILIVKLSSLGDIVHALPVVQDLRRIWPDACIDWVVEPAFAPLLHHVVGIHAVIECPLRRWRREWWRSSTRSEWRAFRRRLQRPHYDAVLDLQGLTKSALVAWLANGRSYGLANRTEGSSFEAPARWLVDDAILIRPRVHALDRSRELAAHALGYWTIGPPRFGLRATLPASPMEPTLALMHGSSRDEKLWPESAWIEIGRRASNDGWLIALPRFGEVERVRANRIQCALGPCADVWPEMDLGALVERLGRIQGAIGVDSGLSHISVALNLPHVQIYNFPTSWRTGPQTHHGCKHQVSIESAPADAVEAVWKSWTVVRDLGRHRWAPDGVHHADPHSDAPRPAHVE